MRQTLGGVCALTIAVLAGTSASAARADGTPFEMAFQANTQYMWTVGFDDHNSWLMQMDPSTSPSITSGPNGGCEVAFRGSDGNLVTEGWTRTGDFGSRYSVKAGTSPSIASDPIDRGGYYIAYQAASGDLITMNGNGLGVVDWGPMMAGSSPSITVLTNGTCIAAYADGQGHLQTVGEDAFGHRLVPTSWGYALAPGTNPSITAVPGGAFKVAFQDNAYTSSGNLRTVGDGPDADWNLGMAAGTSPQHHQPGQRRNRDRVPGQHRQPVDGRRRRRQRLEPGHVPRNQPQHHRINR